MLQDNDDAKASHEYIARKRARKRAKHDKQHEFSEMQTEWSEEESKREGGHVVGADEDIADSPDNLEQKSEVCVFVSFMLNLHLL